MPAITRHETLAIITAVKDRQAAYDFIDEMNDKEGAVIELRGGVEIFGKTGEALAYDDSQHQMEPGSSNAGRGGEYQRAAGGEELALNTNANAAFDILRGCWP